MTLKEKYRLAEWVMKSSLELGAHEAGVTIFSTQSNSVEVRNGRIDKLEQASQIGLSVRLFVDERFSVHSTNRLNSREEIKLFLSKAISGTRYLSIDKFRSLPERELYYKGEGRDLKLFDEKYFDIDPRHKIDIAFALEEEARGLDNRIISLTTSYYDGFNRGVMVTSNGFEGDSSGTYFGVSASVSVDGGDAKPQFAWSESSIFYDKLKAAGVTKIAAEGAIGKIGQGKIESGKMPMIVENRLGGQLIRPLISALNGSAIQQNNSFLTDSLDERVGSEILTIIDDPDIISGRGSRLFDSEGLALSKMPVFSKGVLKNYYIDTYYGKKLGILPSSGSTSNLVFEPGKRSLDEIISSTNKGILVNGFNGGNTNGATGDFSYGIEGYLIEEGRIVKPVSEMNITGNMKQLWMNLEEAANDPYIGSAWRIPALMFKDVEFSGL